MRLATIFVAICIVLIAASAGAVTHFAAGFKPAEAVIVAVAVFAALSLYNAISARIGVRTVVGGQLRDLSRGSADMARRLAELERSLAALARRIDATLDRASAATDPLAVEISELDILVRQLAETVAAHERRLARLGPSAPAAAPPVAEPPPAAAPVPVAAAGTPAATGKGGAPDAILAMIGAAIEANRIDLHLQPIVTLPQRKVRYYEAMSRLRTENGELVPAASFIAQAEGSRLMPKIDNLVIFRCVQVVRRLLIKNREIGLFCNLSGVTLADGAMFPQLVDFLDANRAIAPALLLEFTQSALRGFGPAENESLAALAERGFRFSLDNVTDLRLEPRELADRGFRFVKVPANILLHRAGAAPGRIHSADLANLLARSGIDLIAERIESEGVVVDLLDHDVRFGQGFLFSAPRPLRAEALQGIAERGDLAAREAGNERPPDGASARGSSEATATEPANGKGASALAQLARQV
jgi:cyclic-di-GMP phosphodiesterase, flagellum assembly factor TipF